ncbi:MAG: DUF3810 domain-containing protein [Flavobacteriaceae bacterium]
MKLRILKILSLFFLLQIIVVTIVSAFPDFIEVYYSQSFFKMLSEFQHLQLFWVPFSVGDLFYVVIIIWILKWFLFLFKRKFKPFRLLIYQFLAFLSVTYFIFHVFWGLNYYRNPLYVNLDMDAEYTTEELVDFTCDLIQKSNTLHRQLVANDTLAVPFDFKKNELQALVFETYQGFENENLDLEYPHENLKSSLLSLPLTYAGFSGYINPFTNEAQYNALVPKYKQPTTMAHEIGHQMGYAKENEANFISAIVTMNSEDKYIRYSGLTFALKYSLNDIYLRDPEFFAVIKDEVNPGIFKNYMEVQYFWERYRGPAEFFFKAIYGNYLKVNKQPGGLKSYSYVVALLVNYNKKFNIHQ